ncbi:hypothetical protein [Massilia sp. TN1-12]|uniref:hypothetical protein n=1 Tax=Massilia paldalensis TaxID=3377675 RepID=UPI00385139DA
MKNFALRLVFGFTFAASLAACGSGVEDAQQLQTAAAVQANVAVAAENSPAPDCAADGCKGLRIIDANAEVYRYEAMRRAANEPQG